MDGVLRKGLRGEKKKEELRRAINVICFRGQGMWKQEEEEEEEEVFDSV